MIRFTVFVVALFVSFSAWACGCDPLPFKYLEIKEFNRYDKVVKAEVLDVKKPATTDYKKTDHAAHHHEVSIPKKSTFIKVRVLESIKGKTATSFTIEMKAQGNAYFCTYNKIEAGKTYYFFLTQENRQYTTTYTSRVIAQNGPLPSEIELANYQQKLNNNNLSKKELESITQLIDIYKKQLKREQSVSEKNMHFLSSAATSNTQEWNDFNDNLQAKGKLIQGVAVGKWQFFDHKENVTEEGHYKKSKRHGVWTSYYKSGEVGSITNYKNGRPTGTLKRFHKNGSISMTTPHKKGVRNGLEKSFYENGQTQIVNYYSNDKKQGEQLFYNKEGQLLSKLNFKNGRLHGNLKYYFPSGQLQNEGNYANGITVGQQTSYYQNGQVKEESFASPKGIITKSTSFNENGSINEVHHYDAKGKRISK